MSDGGGNGGLRGIGGSVGFDIPGTIVDSNGLGRFIPEPQTSASINFRTVLSGAAALIKGGIGAATGVEPLYQDLLDKQSEIQLQMQLVTLESNIEKSRHETQMAAIRNVRTG